MEGGDSDLQETSTYHSFNYAWRAAAAMWDGMSPRSALGRPGLIFRTRNWTRPQSSHDSHPSQSFLLFQSIR
jgi:hypothetical protein